MEEQHHSKTSVFTDTCPVFEEQIEEQEHAETTVFPDTSPVFEEQPTAPNWLIIVDELLDAVAEGKWTKEDLFMFRRKTFRHEAPKAGEESYKKFKTLYNKLTPLPSFETLLRA